MSCISTNLSGSLEASPPCVCTLAHFPLYCFMSLNRISNASVHLGPFGCVQRNVFFFCQIHTPHTQNWIQVRPQSVTSFHFCQLYLSFSCFLSPFFSSLPSHLLYLFVSAFLFWLQEENDKDTDRETEAGIVQAEIVGLLHYQCYLNIKVSPPATDSVGWGSA